MLRVVLPGLLPDKTVDKTSVEDPKLDLPPPLEADLVALAGPADVLHVEGQGYREAGFDRRVFSYHLALVLRHPERHVTSVALWLTRPSAAMRLDRIEHSGVSIAVTSVVLADVPASLLLERKDAVCFAAAADAEGMTDEELCKTVARTLREQGATWQKLLLSVTVAAAAGRYDAMTIAMQQEELEPPIIVDLVDYGRDVGRREGVEMGRREGIQQGIELGRVQMARENLLELLSARGLILTDEERAQIDVETSLEQLGHWLRRAARARSMTEVFRS